MRFSLNGQHLDPHPEFALTDLSADEGPRPSDTRDTLHDIADTGYLTDLPTPATANREAAPHSGMVANTPWAGRDSQLMDELHAEYVQLMRDPYARASSQAWHGQLFAPPRALDEFKSEECDHDDVYDLLGETDEIGSVLAGSNLLGEHDILEPEAHVEVLRLFAPADLHDVRSEVPELTRREHHLLSADSALNGPLGE